MNAGFHGIAVSPSHLYGCNHFLFKHRESISNLFKGICAWQLRLYNKLLRGRCRICRFMTRLNIASWINTRLETLRRAGHWIDGDQSRCYENTQCCQILPSVLLEHGVPWAMNVNGDTEDSGPIGNERQEVVSHYVRLPCQRSTCYFTCKYRSHRKLCDGCRPCHQPPGSQSAAQP